MDNSQIVSIMTKDDTGKELVDLAQQTADRLVRDKLGTTQMRTIFTEARQIQATWHDPNAVRRLSLLKPKLFYQTKRQPQVSYLRDVLTPAIDQVLTAPDEEQRAKRFHRFMDLFEAIVAYHYAESSRS